MSPLTTEVPGSLQFVVRPLPTLGDSDIAAMWRLYDTYYGGTSEAIFRADLSAKTHVLLSFDDDGGMAGFSTVEVADHRFAGVRHRVLFSGDTIIRQESWGHNDFACCWIRFAGSVKAEHPDLPLYWLLIVKGHRTYRYLSVFGKRYYPASGWTTPPDRQALLDSLATARFGQAYDPVSGLVRFPESRGYLKEPWAEVPAASATRREVAFFLQRNPRYREGEELACLCEVSHANMKRLTMRWFDEGFASDRQR